MCKHTPGLGYIVEAVNAHIRSGAVPSTAQSDPIRRADSTILRHCCTRHAPVCFCGCVCVCNIESMSLMVMKRHCCSRSCLVCTKSIRSASGLASTASLLSIGAQQIELEDIPIATGVCIRIAKSGIAPSMTHWASLEPNRPAADADMSELTCAMGCSLCNFTPWRY